MKRKVQIAGIIVVLAAVAAVTVQFKKEDAGSAAGMAKWMAAQKAPQTELDAAPPVDLAGINISFKLDPRLTQSIQMGDRWVSPVVYTRVQELGKPLIVDVKVDGLDLAGKQVAVSPAWIPSDPMLIEVSPAQGEQVQITVLRAGQSSLNVIAGEISRELNIKAIAYLGDTMLVEISQ